VDTRVSLALGSGSLSLIAGALAPTGDVVASASESSVVGLLSNELLPFRVTQWGSGGGFAADLGYGGRAGETMLRFSVGGAVLRGSSPLASELTYAPGKQIRGRVEIDSTVGEASVLSFLVGYQYFDVDTYDDRNLFAPGARVEGVVSLAFPVGTRESAIAYAGAYHLRAGISESTGSGPGGLPGVDDRPARTLFTAGGEMRLDRGRFVLTPRGDVRVLRRADGTGQGWLVSVGSRANVASGMSMLGTRWRLEPNVAVRVGSLVAAQSLSSGILGGEAGLTLRWGGPR
jgi:hypothetical protein